MRTVDGLEPWAWSSELYHTADGHLVLYTWPHTMGTDGNYNYRIYEWTEDGYCLEEDLWSEPDEYEWDGTVISCKYFYAKTAADPAPGLTSVVEGGIEWGWDFWQENDYEDDSVGYGIYREIQEEVLNWQ